MAKKKVYREGKWRCTAEKQYEIGPCNHVNRGSALLCEKCHAHRPKNVQFFLDEDAEIITDRKELEKAKAGPNWKCYHCNYDNIAANFHCVHCGELRIKEDEEWLGMEQELKVKKVEPNRATVKPKKKVSPLAKYILFGAAGLALFVGIYFIFFSTTKLEVEVSGFNWEREIEIEKFTTVIEEDWDVPSDGRVIDSERRQSGTKDVYDHSEYYEEPIYEDVQVGTQQVECGTIDKGNGFFETQYCDEPVYERQQVGTETVEEKIYREEPVYDTWYTYEIDVWKYERSVSSSGKDKEVGWPKYNLANKERAGPKNETYIIELNVLDEQSDRKKLSYSTSFNEWSQIKEGDHYIAVVKSNGEVTKLKPVE
jgi:hypothetical protein